MRILLVTSMVPDAERHRRDTEALRRPAARPARAPRGDPGQHLRRRPGAGRGGGSGCSRSGLDAHIVDRRRSRSALRRWRVRAELAASWATKGWPWRVVCGAAGRAAADRPARRRRASSTSSRSRTTRWRCCASRPACRPCSPSTRRCAHRPSEWRAARLSERPAAGAAQPRLAALGRLPAERLEALRPGPGLLRGRCRGRCASRRPSWPRGSASTPTGWCCPPPSTPRASSRARSSSPAPSPTCPTATRRAGWRSEIMPAVRARHPGGAAADRRQRPAARGARPGRARRRGDRRRAQHGAPPRSRRGGAGAGAQRRRHADEGAGGAGAAEGGGDDQPRAPKGSPASSPSCPSSSPTRREAIAAATAELLGRRRAPARARPPRPRASPSATTAPRPGRRGSRPSTRKPVPPEEQRLNRLLRQVDWRFLLRQQRGSAHPRPDGGTALRGALDWSARTRAVGAEADLVVLGLPDPRRIPLRPRGAARGWRGGLPLEATASRRGAPGRERAGRSRVRRRSLLPARAGTGRGRALAAPRRAGSCRSALAARPPRSRQEAIRRRAWRALAPVCAIARAPGRRAGRRRRERPAQP